MHFQTLFHLFMTKEASSSIQVIFVDIKKACNRVIHCIESPLDAGVNYVALSYRWGEVQEQCVDTGVGYTATITSFHLNELYQLCHLMRLEVDLKEVDYLWVDAICVNQKDEKQRKAMIRQMSTIYAGAKYILAVPDLHAASLRHTSTVHTELMNNAKIYQSDLYYLIHGNKAQLTRVEDQWLKLYKVPDDPALRELLRSSTDHFAAGLTENRLHYYLYNGEDILDHLYKSSHVAPSYRRLVWPLINKSLDRDVYRAHSCYQVDCPLDLAQAHLPQWRRDMVDTNGRWRNTKWKHLIHQRSTHIRQSMKFMTDLVRDWSTRVWVISEYNIARKNNNMKYWFTQLEPAFLEHNVMFSDDELRFFEFDLIRYYPSIPTMIQGINDYSKDPISCDPVYLAFHQTMVKQLSHQSFLEMMLKSKATKHEDRFYAILPATEYQDKIGSQVLENSAKINTLTAVKLKLFEFMTCRHKLILLFLSTNDQLISERELSNRPQQAKILPTFATSNIDWEDPTTHDHWYFNNFDLTHPIITLSHDSDLPYLNLKPTEYYEDTTHFDHQLFFDINRTLWERLQPGASYDKNVVIRIPKERSNRYDQSINNHCIYLVGNFSNNVWVLITLNDYFGRAFWAASWKRHEGNEHITGFNIY